MTKSLHDTFYKEIIDTLVLEREKRGVSQTDLAGRLGTTQSAISKIERYERRLDIAEFIRICDVLNIVPAELISHFQVAKDGVSQ